MKQTLSYWLDSMNVISRVNENWDGSMDSESWTDRAASHSIVGKPLFDFICDDVTRMYISSMVESVRVIPRTLFRPYRCDTPDFKRFMMMTVTPEEDGTVRVSHELVRSEPMAKKTLFQSISQTEPIKSATFQGKRAVSRIQFVRCSLCNRIRGIGQTDWVEADSVAGTAEPMRVVYGICPGCLQYRA